MSSSGVTSRFLFLEFIYLLAGRSGVINNKSTASITSSVFKYASFASFSVHPVNEQIIWIGSLIFVVINVNNIKMRFIDALCPPALLYLIYIVVHVGLDLSLGLFATAAIKIVMGIAGTLILDVFCGIDLGIVSWAVVATPFIMTALATSISLGIGLDRMIAKNIEGFSPLTADNSKNRDIYVTQLKQKDALPISTDSTY